MPELKCLKQNHPCRTKPSGQQCLRRPLQLQLSPHESYRLQHRHSA